MKPSGPGLFFVGSSEYLLKSSLFLFPTFIHLLQELFSFIYIWVLKNDCNLFWQELSSCYTVFKTKTKLERNKEGRKKVRKLIKQTTHFQWHDFVVRLWLCVCIHTHTQIFEVLRIVHRASHILGNHSTAKLYIPNSVILFYKAISISQFALT